MQQADFNPDIDLVDFQPAKFLAFRDMEVGKRVARIKKADLCALPIVEPVAENLAIELTA